MKETHYKLKHRVTALFAAAVMLCSMLPGAAFAEEPTPQPTEETAQMEQQTEPSETDNGQTDESSPDPGEDVTEATPEAAEEQPAEEEIHAAVVGAELYTDLPNAPIGSYIGSEGLPVATGETKIGISEWPESQLEETSGSYLTAAALDNDGLTMAAPLLDGADYAIVPIMAQVEYPADGSTLDLVLPDSVTLLDYYGAPAADAESLLHSELSLLNTGVRRAELAGLTWSDFDFKECTVHVNKSLLVFRDFGYQHTATKESNDRYIDVAPEYMEFMQQYKEWWYTKKRLMGASWQRDMVKNKESKRESLMRLAGEEFVIIDDFGWPRNPDGYNALVKRVAKKAGLKDIHPHMFRHTFVSLLMSNPDIGVATVAAEAGHAQPSTTLMIYTQQYKKRRESIRNQLSRELYEK